jgi:DNA (cytosine-5)-methyltransferase 1
MLRHGSLFSGIGGFDLAAEWMGWENVFHCEIDPFGQRVLKHHFPNSKAHEDIKELEATQYHGRVDIITGGFPCQPFSNAGQRKGTQDDRHLWPEMLRVIREVSPTFVVGENVRGLLNWSGPNGEPNMVFNQVCSDLEAEGYEVAPLILPACGKNAPHRRDRIWFVAHSSNGQPREDRGASKGKTREVRGDNEGTLPDGSSGYGNASHTNRGLREQPHKEVCPRGDAPDSCNQRNATYTDHVLSERRDGSRENGRGEQKKRAKSFGQPRGWEKFPTQPPLCGGDDGLPKELDGITFSKWRGESIKAYGNAIVPQVAYEIFRAIQETHLYPSDLNG